MKSFFSDTRNMVGVVIAVCAVIVGYAWYANRPSPADRAAPTVSDGPVLKKQWERFERDDSNIIVSGEVTNISRNPVAYFQATTTFYDKKGRAILTNPAAIDHVSLEPGETTKYKTLSAPLSTILIEVTNFTDVSGIPIPTEKAPQTSSSSRTVPTK